MDEKPIGKQGQLYILNGKAMRKTIWKDEDSCEVAIGTYL